MSSPANPLQSDPRVAALIQAMQGNSGSMTSQQVPPPDQMPTQGVLPPASPVGQQAYDPVAMAKQFSSMPNIAGPTAAMDQQRQQIGDLSKQRSDMPIPKQGWLDTQGQPQKTGFLHGLLRALTAVASATTPGQAIEGAIYNPGIKTYNKRQQLLADQIQAVKDQSGISEDELRSGTSLAATSGTAGYRQGELGIQSERNQIAKTRSDTQAANVARQASNDLVRQSQGWQRLSQDQQKIAAQQWFQRAEIQVANSRIAAGMDENSARLQAQQDIKAEMAQNQYAVQHPILGPMLQSLGMGPALTSTPAAQTPVVTPKPQAKPTPKPKVLVEGKDF